MHVAALVDLSRAAATSREVRREVGQLNAKQPNRPSAFLHTCTVTVLASANAELELQGSKALGRFGCLAFSWPTSRRTSRDVAAAAIPFFQLDGAPVLFKRTDIHATGTRHAPAVR